MATLFTKIIEGEIPGHIIWKDDDIAAFLTIGPLTEGHTLVVPRQEIDRWTDADPQLLQKLITVAQRIGQAQVEVFGSQRAGLSIVGFEIEHLHMHVWPVNSMADYDFSKAENNPDPDKLMDAAVRLREALGTGTE